MNSPKPRLSHPERSRLIRQFWHTYFKKFPDQGSIPELNRMRSNFKRQRKQ